MDEPRYHLGSVVHAKGETLEDFDGPLDVILLLLSKNKIEIQDIQISAILEQYLAYLDEMKRMDMEIASEFIAMASYLMYIKTRMLLSKAEQEEAQSEMDKLVESLQKRQRQDAYQQIQKAAKQLGARNELGLGLFTKGPEPYQPDQTYRYRHDRADLTAALAAMQDRTERRLPPPVSNFAGHRRHGALSRHPEGQTGHQPPDIPRRDALSRPVQGQPQPLGDRGNLPRRAGAVPPAVRIRGRGRERRTVGHVSENTGCGRADGYFLTGGKPWSRTIYSGP